MFQPPISPSPPPIKVTKKPDPCSRICAFEIQMSSEMAQVLMAVAAPFLAELSTALARHEQQEKERLAGLVSVQDAAKRRFRVALKALRLARRRRAVLDDVISEVALAHNIPARTLFAEAQMLQKRRGARLTRYRDRDIVTPFLLGVSKAQLAHSYDLSVYQITQILNRALSGQEATPCVQ